MPFIVLASQLSFQKTKADSPTEPDGPETIVQRGTAVPGWVATFIVNALASSGLVVWAEDSRNTGLVAPGQEPGQYRTPDQPVTLPSDPNGAAPTLGDLIPDPAEVDGPPAAVPDADGGGGAQEAPPVPKASDNKETWEQYAATYAGIPLGTAEAMTKAELIAEVKGRVNQ